MLRKNPLLSMASVLFLVCFLENLLDELKRILIRKMSSYQFMRHHHFSHSVVGHVKSFFQSHLNLTVLSCTTFRPVLVTLPLNNKNTALRDTANRQISLRHRVLCCYRSHFCCYLYLPFPSPLILSAWWWLNTFVPTSCARNHRTFP